MNVQHISVVQARETPAVVITAYFNEIIDAGLLEDRFCDRLQPDMDDVFGVVKSPLMRMFLVHDNAWGKIIAEFTLENFTGMSAMIHFSIHPKNMV